MVRKVDLIMYLPSVMKRYLEIQKIMQTENPEFDLLWDADGLIRLNLYIITAQEEGLKRYERILGITPAPDDGFETRRSRIIARWNDFTPYTLKYLIGLLSILANGHFEIKTNFPSYEINITVTLTASGAVDDLAYILKNIIPCNLTVISKNEINVGITGEMRFASGVKETITYFITNDINKRYTVQVPIRGGSTLKHSAVYSVANGFQAGYPVHTGLNGGSALNVCTSAIVNNST